MYILCTILLMRVEIYFINNFISALCIACSPPEQQGQFRVKLSRKCTALTNVFAEKVVLMVMFVWLMAQHPMREELKCAKMMNGVQSVIMDGAHLMHK